MTIALALFGLVVGSFLNVCIYRLPRNQSIVWPASRCTSCGRPLAWYENVPVVSWLVLRGRCRTCRARISAIYPVVELMTAASFVAVGLRTGHGPLLYVRLLFVASLIVLFSIDVRHKILPNAITVPGIAVGLVSAWFLPPGWSAALIGAAGGAALLWGIAYAYYRVREEEGLGMGDVKMLAMIGAFLGWKLMLLTIVLASLSGSIVGLAIVLIKRGSMKYALPFGTFLAVGALVALLAGDGIVEWYLGLYP